jgi:hypothetical protein
MKNLFLIMFFVGGINLVKAQYIMLGDAKPMQGGCIQLTPDNPYREGIAWSKEKVDLNGFFEIQFDIYLGNKDELGADGIAFVIHDDARQFEAFGTYGECMGYGRWRRDILSGNYIAPSIAIEFDTYQNYTQNDPASDHVAYLENGTNYHTAYWNNDDENFSLEDDKLHDFRFRWEPELKRITVHLDGIQVYQGNRNLVEDIFKGNSSVIWGFTASTGRKYNLQYFCLKRMALDSNQLPEIKLFLTEK